MGFHIFCHGSFHPYSFARFMSNLSLALAKMQNCNEEENVYPGLNTRIYRVARKPAKTPVELPKLGNPGLKLGIKEGDYSEVFYRVGFKVNKEVSLVALEFFGPSEKNVGRYQAEVGISRIEEDWGWLSWLYYFSDKPMYRIVDLQPYHAQYVEARKEENFIVRLPEPVVVPPNLWTDIKFKLDGPITKFMEFEPSEQKVYVDGLGPYTFDFLRGSKQLAAIHFIV